MSQKRENIHFNGFILMEDHDIVFVGGIEIIYVRAYQDFLSKVNREAFDKSAKSVDKIYLGSGSEEELNLAIGIIIYVTGSSAYLLVKRNAPKSLSSFFLQAKIKIVLLIEKVGFARA